MALGPTDTFQIVQGLEAWGIITTLAYMIVGGYVTYVARRWHVASNSIERMTKLFFPDGLDKESSVDLGDLNQAVENADKALRDLQQQHDICRSAQEVCLETHRKFIEAPHQLCKAFDECPATKDARAKAIIAVEVSRQHREEVLRRLDTQLEVLREFSQNTSSQIIKAMDVLAVAWTRSK